MLRRRPTFELKAAALIGPGCRLVVGESVTATDFVVTHTLDWGNGIASFLAGKSPDTLAAS